MTGHSLSDRLLQALLTIHQTPPRLLAAPPVSRTGVTAKSKRASVAIILRVRPTPSYPSTADYDAGFPNSSPIRSRAQSVASIDTESGNLSATSHRILDFFAQPWVQSGIPEILYIKRATRASDRWSAQVAFPGGRQELDDENPLYTAMRETWEEVGIDLAEKKDFVEVGQLDDREITTSLGKRLLMVLSPFVFLHTSPQAPVPEIQASEVASAHWVPLTCLLAPHVRWGDVRIDIMSRIMPKNSILCRFLTLLTGNMHFKSILLPNDPVTPLQAENEKSLDPAATFAERLPLSLWGLTLGMSLDLLSHMELPESSEISRVIAADKLYASSPSEPLYDMSAPQTPHSAFPLLLAPSMTSIFPTFSYPDINLFIWMFGFRYRHLVRRWGERFKTSSSGSTTPAIPHLRRRASSAAGLPATPGAAASPHGGRVNFAGMALNQFYAAVRRALIVAVVARAVLLLGSTTAATLWLIRKLRDRRKRLHSS